MTPVYEEKLKVFIFKPIDQNIPPFIHFLSFALSYNCCL